MAPFCSRAQGRALASSRAADAAPVGVQQGSALVAQLEVGGSTGVQQARAPAPPTERGRAAPELGSGGWQAELSLEFDLRQGRSVLARAEHRGPLRVQRPFYPEGAGTCHVYLLHPPGGLASGDELRVRARLEPGASALVTTPGAGKFYRARERAVSHDPGQPPRTASLSQQLTLGPGARLEWFPQESIVFEGADARVVTHVALAPDAAFAGWEIVCLGRPACAEAFRRGALRSELRVQVGERLRFMERGLYRGGDPLLSEAWGLGGAPVFGSFVVAHPEVCAAWLEPLRAEVEARAGLFGVTLMSGVIVGRYLGASTLDARACFERMFRLLRPHYAQRAAVTPRIWST